MSSEQRTEVLERQIDDLEKQVNALRHQLAELELDRWRGRIDDLEVQLHLASLDVRDKYTPLVGQLRDTWLDARERVTDGVSSASDATGALREGLEKAMGDIRNALMEAKSTITG